MMDLIAETIIKALQMQNKLPLGADEGQLEDTALRKREVVFYCKKKWLQKKKLKVSQQSLILVLLGSQPDTKYLSYKYLN
jgi:hypothetical protein